MVLVPPNIIAYSLFLSTTLRGNIPDNMEKKPYEFNTNIAYALKEGLDLDGITTESHQTRALNTNPKEFYERVEEIETPHLA